MKMRSAACVMIPASLLSGCIGPPPNRYPPNEAYFPPTRPAAPPPIKSEDVSTSDIPTAALVGGVVGAAGGYGAAKIAAPTPAPVAPKPGLSGSAAAGSAEAEAAAAAEGRTAAGFAARLRANPALRFMAGAGTEEGVAATAAGGAIRFALRGVIVPLVAAAALYALMSK